MIDGLVRLLEFLGAYPNWVKHTVLTLLAVIVAIVVIFRPTTKPGWKIQVYYFKNMDVPAETVKFGERFSGLLLDSLLKMDLDAHGELGAEPDDALFDVGVSRGPEPEKLNEDYGEMAPFISVTGFVEYRIKGAYVVHVRVSAVHQNLRIRTLVVRELEVGSNNPDMKAKADALAKVIFHEVDSLAKGKAA